jgi:multidrug efflux pump subunit AcrA (membrane-fusion protein)
LAIPTAAVFNLGGQDFIYLAKPQSDANPKALQAQQVPVTLGDIVGNYYTVLKGVQAGDVLITSGIQKLKNGAAIQVVPSPKPHD